MNLSTAPRTRSRTNRFLPFLIVLGLLLSLFVAPLPQVAHAASADCNILWSDVLHDTYDPVYRSITGPTTPNNTVKLRVRVAQSDITSARVRVWNARAQSQTYYNMAWDGSYDTSSTYDWWSADLPVGSQSNILYYFFELNDNGGGSCTTKTNWYVDDDIKFYGGGMGAMSSTYDDSRSFQITIYDASYSVPSWMQRGIVYQVFPDRFRDGNSANNPAAGRFSYNGSGSISRSNQANWNYTVCDPRSTYAPACSGKYGDNFYGGDLAGIKQKIDDGYFDSLGVTVLYLNPIFRSPSNHKYDTADYMTIDPDFGTLTDFQNLVTSANSHGIKLILDGVFNHTSSDSKYFDLYSRYDAAGNLTSPGGVGTNDGSGACEATASTFRSWFYFSDTDTIWNPGDGGTTKCANNTTYEAWYGYGALPKLKSGSTAVRSLFYSNGLNSVGPYWTQKGAAGWRFDVGGDVDPGMADPANNFWEAYRTAVRNAAVTGKSDTLMLGEEWGDASNWLLGSEWDSVMNYRFRSAVLSWLFTSCSGNGCAGGVFSDNDSQSGSHSGAISYISPSQFNGRLRSIQEDYPPMAFKAMMNLTGSHDTNRLRFLLKQINGNSDSVALQRLKEWYLFAFTYAGAPTLYYGDEIALSHDAVWSGSTWEDDPYNRTPYPWPDATGTSYSGVSDVQSFTRTMASIRLSYRALQDGDVQHGMIINDAAKVYGFGRTNGSQTALVALNRNSTAQNATFAGLNAAPYNLPDGTVLINALTGTTYTVTGGAVTLSVPATWGVVLLEQSKIETPAAPTGLTKTVQGSDKLVSWNPSVTDTAGGRELAVTYEVYRGTTSTFTPASGNRIATVTPPAYGGTSTGKISYTDVGAGPTTYYYKIRAINQGSKQSTTAGF